MAKKFLSKFGLAFHLALLAALPPALAPFLGEGALGSVMLWLSALAGLWLFTEPSLRLGERLSGARRRVRRELVRDPLFWMMAFACVYAFLRWLNIGVEQFFDAEKNVWTVKEPAWSGLPGSAGEAGYLPFTATVAATVVLAGLRNGLGKNARFAFGSIGAFIAGLGGIAAVVAVRFGHEGAADWMGAGFAQGPYWTVIFGAWLLVSALCTIESEKLRWPLGGAAGVVSMAGCLCGLVFFAPPFAAACWIGATALFAVFGFVYLARAASAGSVARFASYLLFAVAACVLAVVVAMPKDVRSGKLRRMSPSEAFVPHEADAAAEKMLEESSSVLEARSRAARVRTAAIEKAERERAALDALAVKMWKANPWGGVGLGGFAVNAPFTAQKKEWRELPAKPEFAPNGFADAIAERGIVGMAVLAFPALMLLWWWGARLWGAVKRQKGMHARGEDDVDIFVFAVPPLAWIAPLCMLGFVLEAVHSPLLREPAALLALSSAAALSAASFPKDASGRDSKEKAKPKDGSAQEK